MANPWEYSSATPEWVPQTNGPEHGSRVAGLPPGAKHPLPVTEGVEEIELFLSPFAGIGRMAHLRRELSSLRGVRSVKIGGLLEQTAHFLVTLDPGSSLSILVLANTVVVRASASRLDLSLRTSGGRDRPFGRPRHPIP